MLKENKHVTGAEYLRSIGVLHDDELRELKFDMRFVVPIIDGEKRNTIRRDTNLIVGECVKLVALELELGGAAYSDIKVATITAILPVLIDYEHKSVMLSGVLLEYEQIRELFYDNGWACIEEGFEYYKGMYGTTFEGVNIQWD